MNDPRAMGGVERVGHLDREPSNIIECERTLADPISERVTLDQFHHEKRCAGFGADVVQLADVSMREPRNGASLPLEAGHRLR